MIPLTCVQAERGAVVEGGHALAQAVVYAIREPLLVLDEDLRVVTANRSFYMIFRMQRQDVQGLPLYALGDGQWDILELRSLLSDIAPQHAVTMHSRSNRTSPSSGDARSC